MAKSWRLKRSLPPVSTIMCTAIDNLYAVNKSLQHRLRNERRLRATPARKPLDPLQKLLGRLKRET
jgi:hypothetical protein